MPERNEPMNDLKAAIKCIWLGTAASLIGLLGYLIWRGSEKTILLSAMEKTILFLATGMILIFALSACLRIVRARERIESEVDFGSLPQAKQFIGIVTRMGFAYGFAIVLFAIELLLTKNRGTFFIVAVQIATIILSVSTSISFAVYMKKRMRLSAEHIQQMFDSLAQEARDRRPERERELWGDPEER
jgi:hypothetical protein